ncbi:OmpR family transcriptional regulatory protein [Klebsiella pneumoniae]|uniref:OmpR family transcriptional regulatory protein n=1 Tax=Klebsiella pneumoniae TaxID=573 RepID=A0A2X3ILK6_KLEPN|nr:OmpR family transcriptional regulatory protein [Klebsiella pneumoniae]
MLNRDQLLNLTQGRDAELFERSIDLLVSRLRQRLREDAREPAYIKTVRSEGYVLSVPGNDSNLLIVFYVQIMPDDLVMQLHRF